MICEEYELSVNNEDTNDGDQIVNDGAAVSDMSSSEHNQYEYCDSLEVSCPVRNNMTNKALKQVNLVQEFLALFTTGFQVEDLLTGIEDCERLFPSTRHLVTANISWGEEEFQTRYTRHNLIRVC